LTVASITGAKNLITTGLVDMSSPPSGLHCISHM
jgi:hypothetical protein